MTPFERLYALLSPFEHPLHQHVQRTLRSVAKHSVTSALLLDVGGRRSNYTINVPAGVWITDVPRERDIQHALDLGATDEIRLSVLRRRSNVSSYLYDDMTQTQLPAANFSIVSAIEVLEHVEEDEAFVRNVFHVLRPGGMFLMTTPNGDHVPTPYPDHKRHYRRNDLERLLRKYFPIVSLEYRVNAGKVFSYGLHRPSAGSPIRSMLGMTAFAVSGLLERLGAGGQGPRGKLHIMALCQKGQ